MELQLIRVEWSEQARDSRSFVSEENVHSSEGFVFFEGACFYDSEVTVQLKMEVLEQGIGRG